MKRSLLLGLLGFAGLLASPAGGATEEADRRTVAMLDTEFQAAVKRNDADAIARILHKDMVLVLGDGSVSYREDQIQEARDKAISYERQDEDPGSQSVRVSGETAIVTARLWIKGVRSGTAFDRRVWFSDTYVRTAAGWQYFFGQASLPLPHPTRAGEDRTRRPYLLLGCTGRASSGARVIATSKLFSQVLPPSAEKDCCRWCVVGVISDQVMRTKIARPL
jgi:ketosteroid isomerase-like protein